MSYLVYLVSTSESATVLNTPVFELDHTPDQISDEQLFEMVGELSKTEKQTIPDDITTGHEALDWMRYDQCFFYSENLLVVVPNTELLKYALECVGDALMNTMDNDSSSYRAAEVWCSVVRSHKVVEFSI